MTGVPYLETWLIQVVNSRSLTRSCKEYILYRNLGINIPMWSTTHNIKCLTLLSLLGRLLDFNFVWVFFLKYIIFNLQTHFFLLGHFNSLKTKMGGNLVLLFGKLVPYILYICRDRHKGQYMPLCFSNFSLNLTHVVTRKLIQWTLLQFLHKNQIRKPSLLSGA